MPEIALPALEAVVTLHPCQAPPPDPVVTTTAPVHEHQSLYLSAREYVYALNAADGSTRWCQQVQLIRTREVRYPPEVSVPPPPRAGFATPRVVGGSGTEGVGGVEGVVFVVCEYGFGSHTCAFAADDGALRWWTPTDVRVISMPFMDWAVPLVRDGVVYSGSFALNERDGSVRWRVAIDTNGEGAMALHALTHDTLFATTTRGIYAINIQDGQIRWLYQPKEQYPLSGPPVLADGLLYSGTLREVGYPLQSFVFALDGASGEVVWRYRIVGHYSGAVADHARLYVFSSDGALYVWDRKSGQLAWQHQFGRRVYQPATIANDVLYLAADGAYALNSMDGTVLWHEPLESGRSVSFHPPVVLDGAVYLVRLDGRSRGMLYALDARTGAECWHTPYPLGGALLAVAQ